MNTHRGLGLYRGLLLCYPRSFRREYGPDMVLLFSDQLGDEPAPRVWCRGLIDLAVTVPTRHLEAHMNRPPNSLVPVALGALAVAAVATALTVVSARQTRRITAATSTTAQWWKPLALGASALLAMIIAEGATDLSLWMPMIITVLFSLLMIATGLVLGIAHLLTTHSRHAAH
jgi:hypothetical protein